MTTTCEMTERSARGYCPDEVEGHKEELCAFGAEWADAPFCSGPSDQGAELIPPLTLERDDSFTDVCVEQGLNFDYETGTCETTAPAAAPERETLPEAGSHGLMILVVGMVALAVGLWLISAR